MTDNILHTENLEFGHKKPLTAAISLTANRGDMVCIIGRNGCGKSTLLNTITGIKQALSGKIILDNKNINKIPLREKSKLVSFVPSKPEFLSNLTVYELAAMGRSPYTNIFDNKTNKDTKIIESAILDFNLNDLRNRSLWSLSDGERQRAMICRAVIQETPVIILDEPTAFLDYYMRLKLLSDLKDLSQKQEKCIIFSSHDVEIAVKYATKVWFFNDNFVEQYSSEDFIRKGVWKNLTQVPE